MPNVTQIFSGKILSKSPVVLLARVYDLETGDLINPDDIASLTVNVFNRETKVSIGSFNPVVGQSLFGSLLTDERWTQDSTGYNCAITIEGSYFPDAISYRIEVFATPLDDEYETQLTLGIWNLRAEEIYSTF